MPDSVLIETLDDPLRYTPEQLRRARLIAELLGRGRLILCETPER
jgi:hypothetical protein